MKRTLPSRGFAFASFALFYSLLLTSAFAQNAQSERDVKVTWQKTENGQVQKIEKAVPIQENGQISDILQEFKIMEELGELAPGEEVEIIIRRKKGPEVIKDLNITLDDEANIFQFDAGPEGLFDPPAARPLLGVEFDEVTGEMAREKGFTGNGGSHVTKVLENTAAQKAGFQQGDIITHIDGIAIEEWLALRKLIGTHNAGDEVTVTFFRAGETVTKKVVLGENKQDWMNKREWHNQGGSIFDKGLQGHQRSLWDEKGASADKNAADANRAFLGVYLDVLGENGVKVTKVIKGTLAEKVGLQNGDVITGINGNPINRFDDLTQALKDTKVGDNAKINFLRDGKEMTASGKLGSKADAEQAESDRYKSFFQNGCDGNMDKDHLFRLHDSNEEESEGAKKETYKEISLVIKMEDVTEAEVVAFNAASEAGTISSQNDLEMESLVFFPNPSDGNFTLRFNLESRGDTEVEVFTMEGKKVFTESLADFSGNYNGAIDITTEANGIYYLNVRQGEKSWSKKIIKQ